MRIRRLELHDFRRYRDLAVDLAPGLTVIRGPNEAGKTTIQRAIELAITRRVTSSAGDLDALRPWDAAADARSVITIEFEQDDEDGAKTGTLEKTFAGSRGTVKLDYDGQSIADPALADQVLAELTGIPTEAFFRSTASVRHHELADLGHDEGALRDRLQASISGGDRGTSRAKRKLDRALHDLQTKGEKNPGRLKIAEAEVAKSAAAFEQGEVALAQLSRDRDTLAGALERRADVRGDPGRAPGHAGEGTAGRTARRERDAAQDRYERFRQAVEVDGRGRPMLAASHPSANPLPVVRAGVERLRQLDQKVARAAGGAVRRDRGVLRGRGRAQLAAAVALGHRADDHRRARRGRHVRWRTS